MLNSILLHLPNEHAATPAISWGVEIARQTEARLRGLTLLDTREAETVFPTESGVFAEIGLSQHVCADQQSAVRTRLSAACLDANLDFDIRTMRGNPLSVLPEQARYHDLVMTSRPVNLGSERNGNELSSNDIRQLLDRGVQPLMVAGSGEQVRRVLLAYDGSEPSGRSIRSFLAMGILADREYRLLAVGKTETAARTSLQEMGDYCQTLQRSMETGWACGSLHRLLPVYAEKWQPDLIVLGAPSGTRLLRGLSAGATLGFLGKLSCGFFIVA